VGLSLWSELGESTKKREEPMAIRSDNEINRHLIMLLQANGREPLASLARKVGLSRNAVSERLKGLERDGVIAGYTVRLAAESTAQPQVRAYMMLYLDGPICERVLPGVLRLPEIKLSQSLGGEIDMIVYVETEKLEDMNRVRDELESIHGVRKVTTAIVLTDRFDRR
jgi:Lrp/AsnC family leucine-responsive transcriptional regulator